MGASLENKKRLGWLDFGKAMGILVVLLVHAECRLGPVTYYGGMFYMPVFFVSAGYTYRYRPEAGFGIFVKKKAKRLLIPYAGASIFLWFFFWVKDCVLAGYPLELKVHSLKGILYSRNQMYAPGYAGENPVLLDVLNAPLWFLTAMFLTYLWYDLACRSGKKYLTLAAGLILTVVWHYVTDLLLPWSLDAVPYFACFMAAGEFFRDKDAVTRLLEKWYRIFLIFVIFAGLAYWNGSVNLSCGSYGKSMMVYLVIGSLGALLVFAAGASLENMGAPILRAAGWIGQETMTILCFHMFLFMFIKTAANVVGLGAGLTKAGLVIGSLAGSAFAKMVWRYIRKRVMDLCGSIM